MIEPVPRAEAERLFPHLIGKPLWGEEASYDMKQCAGLHWIVYAPVDIKALTQALRIFKSVKVVTRESKND